MLLFRRAHFTNFRILRDLELEFSTDEAKPLTVIRGENESGKTSILWAMQWAFFGDAVLPDEGKEFRLHPLDWEASDGRCVISVEIDFETEAEEDGVGTGLPRRYLVNRQCVEELRAGGGFVRHSAMVTLQEVTDQGMTPKDHPELHLATMFPKELNEVFFTDGARVLSFTGAELSQTTKRKRVQDAIRALLGLDLLQDAVKHVKNAQDDLNSQLKQTADDVKLQEITDQIGKRGKELAGFEEQLRLADEGVANVEIYHRETHGKLEAALTKGNKDELARELRDVRAAMVRHRDQLDLLKTQRSELFKDEGLAAGLLHKQLAAAHEKLADMKERALIPRSFLPIIEDRIAAGTCICGTPLIAGSPYLEHLQHLKTEQNQSDAVSSRLSELVPAARRLNTPANSGGAWLARVQSLLQIQANEENGLRESQTRYRELELTIKGLPDTDVVQLKEQLADLSNNKDRFVSQKATAGANIARLKRELEALTQEQNTYMKMKTKYRRQRAQLLATQDIGFILGSAYTAIQATKISAVAERMNEYFLEMIGSSEEHGIIQRAEINSDFDIIVSGPKGHQLDPDHDLNGASRRALTLAFILAVTTVSGVTAPSVIDTPISELSGPVRSEVLRITASLSRQLILFLTGADIHGVESIIDSYAGKVITITNSTHYPHFLVNDPHSANIAALACPCSHREYCGLCERLGDNLDSSLHSRKPAMGVSA